MLKNITEKLYRLAKYNYYWQTEVNSVFADSTFELKEKDQIRAKVNVDPENPSYVNITVHVSATTVCAMQRRVLITDTKVNHQVLRHPNEIED